MSGTTVDSYTSCRWHKDYQPPSADERRLMEGDGLSSLERTVQDALALKVLRRVVHDPQDYALLWLRHGTDNELRSIFCIYLSEIMAVDQSLPVELCVQVTGEWSGMNVVEFSAFLKRSSIKTRFSRSYGFSKRAWIKGLLTDRYHRATRGLQSDLKEAGLIVT